MSCIPKNVQGILEVLRLQGLQKSSGRIFTIYACQNEAVCCEVQTHFEVLRFQVLQKKIWAHFHDLYVKKHSCLLWNSDAFCKFSPCTVCKKYSGHTFTIHASKN